MLSGVYLPAFNKKKIIKKFKLRKNFQILGSAHNLIEINRKIEQGCEIIFLAPLFFKILMRGVTHCLNDSSTGAEYFLGFDHAQ